MGTRDQGLGSGDGDLRKRGREAREGNCCDCDIATASAWSLVLHSGPNPAGGLLSVVGRTKWSGGEKNTGSKLGSRLDTGKKIEKLWKHCILNSDINLSTTEDL